MASTTFVEWEENEKTNSRPGGAGGGSKNGFLKLQNGVRYRVRLVSKPVRYFQHWEPVPCRSPGIDESTGQTIDPLMQLGYKPKKTFAIWVIDRADGQFKVMDFPQSLYNEFLKWKQGFNEDPGGHRGPDFQIWRECPSGNKMQTRYNAIALDRVEFTEDEKTFIKNNNLRQKIEDLRKAHSPEEIKQLLAKHQEGGGAPKGRAPQGHVPPAPPAQPNAPSKPVDDFTF